MGIRAGEAEIVEDRPFSRTFCMLSGTFLDGYLEEIHILEKLVSETGSVPLAKFGPWRHRMLQRVHRECVRK